MTFNSTLGAGPPLTEQYNYTALKVTLMSPIHNGIIILFKSWLFLIDFCTITAPFTYDLYHTLLCDLTLKGVSSIYYIGHLETFSFPFSCQKVLLNIFFALLFE